MTRRFSFWTVAATLALFLFAAAAPSPLYAVYAARWRFSAITLTEVFAVYAVALLVALLLTGSLSDFAGRRPVILGAIAIEVASMRRRVRCDMAVRGEDHAGHRNRVGDECARGGAGGPAAFRSPAAARATGERGDPGRGPGRRGAGVGDGRPVRTGSAPPGLLANRGGPPRLWGSNVPDAGTRAEEAWIQPGAADRVEAAMRTQFVASLPSLIAGWAVGGFYLSLGPSLLLQLGSSTNRLLGGSTITVLGGVGSVAIIALQAWAPRRTMIVGGTAMTAGLTMAVVAVSTTSPGLFFASTAVTGVGFGIGWLGVLRTLVALAAPTARAALLAAIFIVAYLSFAIPAVIAGYLVTRIGLHQAALWYAAAMDVLAIIGLTGALLVRPPATVVPASAVSRW